GHGGVELSTYCEGYFLQNMAGLLEREAFRTLILGLPSGRAGNNISTQATLTASDFSCVKAKE
ncbi:hypothetical protein M9458_048963, partial [Cirrhinus mrigala]